MSRPARNRHARLLGLLAGLLAVLAFAPPARADVPLISWPAEAQSFANRTKIDARQGVSQAFQARGSGVLTHVRISLIAQTRVAPKLDVRVQVTEYGPDAGPGPVLAETVVRREEIPILASGGAPDPVPLTLTFPTSVTFEGGREYRLVLTAVDADPLAGDANVLWLGSTARLRDGAPWTNSRDGVWQPARTDCSSCRTQSLEVFIEGQAGDADGDGVQDVFDNCPTVSNRSQADNDNDDIGNDCDTDIDGDGYENTDDAFPYDPMEWRDTDGDGMGDIRDRDADGDTVSDNVDNCEIVQNLDQADLDGDAVGDACDSDRDGDAVENGLDNCADLPNDQSDLDADALGDACDLDDDGDAVADDADNCPAAANPGQRDSDDDGLGDACDAAFDSTDGAMAGGGWVTVDGRRVHFAFSALSLGTHVAGLGVVRDGATRIRLVRADGFRRVDDRAIVVGDATVDGTPVRFRLVVRDAGEPGAGQDTIELEAGDRTLSGTVAAGNVQVLNATTVAGA